jgi:hypothetical protein
MIPTPLFIGLLVAGAVLHAKYRVWPRLKNRPRRTSKEFFRDFYQSSGFPEPFIIEMYEFIESNFGTASQLHPTDSFADVEGASPLDYDNDTSFLLDAAYLRLTKNKADDGRDKEIEAKIGTVKTVDDLVKLFARYEL